MDGLRWLLLLFGLLVIVGVYFYSRRERDRKVATSPPQAPARAARIEPSLDAQSPLTEPSLEASAPVPDTETGTEGISLPDNDPPPDEPPPDPPPAPREKIVTLRVVARHHTAFAGDELALTLRGIGMRHGRFGIFHRYDQDDENRIIFSAASLVEPGSFDLANLKAQRIPGISLFLVLPGPLPGAEAYDLMVAAGRALSKSLPAELLDESGSTFSIQRERYLREEIIQYQHGIKVA